MFTCFHADLFAGKHPGDLADAGGGGEFIDLDGGPAPGVALGDGVMVVGKSCNLSEMGDAEDLVAGGGEGLEAAADGFASGAADAGIDFIEDEGPAGGSDCILLQTSL